MSGGPGRRGWVYGVPHRAVLCGNEGLASLEEEAQPEISQLLPGRGDLWAPLEVFVEEEGLHDRD